VASAATSALIAVAAGAFAAHAVSDPAPRELLKTGASYQMTHALAALAGVVLAELGLPRGHTAAALFLAGTTFFSGSLYGLASGAPPWTGALTPIGGLLFMFGWAMLAWASIRRPKGQ